MEGAGGTAGGIGSFLVGFIMAVAGGYLITQHVQVSIGSWGYLFGYNAFGLTLVPLVFGVGLLFFDGRSKAGWLLTVAGATVIFFGILMHLRLTWSRASLYDILVMIVLLAGGLGLLARSLRPLEKKG